jgi:hypothetical protein
MKSRREVPSPEKSAKEKAALPARRALEKAEDRGEIFSILSAGTGAERGTMAEALQRISEDNAEILLPHLGEIIGKLDDKAAPRPVGMSPSHWQHCREISRGSGGGRSQTEGKPQGEKRRGALVRGVRLGGNREEQPQKAK